MLNKVSYVIAVVTFFIGLRSVFTSENYKWLGVACVILAILNFTMAWINDHDKSKK